MSDEAANNKQDYRCNEICGNTGVQGTSREDESDVREASDRDATAKNGADKGDPSSPHACQPFANHVAS